MVGTYFTAQLSARCNENDLGLTHLVLEWHERKITLVDENGYLHIDHDVDTLGSWLRLRLLAHRAPAPNTAVFQIDDRTWMMYRVEVPARLASSLAALG